VFEVALRTQGYCGMVPDETESSRIAAAHPMSETPDMPSVLLQDMSNLASENSWALKRDWTDTEFQDGAEGNKIKLQSFEDELLARLRSSSMRVLGKTSLSNEAGEGDAASRNILDRVLEPLLDFSDGPSEQVRNAVLDDPVVLGSALDIAGAYLKNYAVDKAGAVVETVLPICRKRGGFWLLKALNHLATVRMKQARPAEALSTLQEMDAYVNSSMPHTTEEEAWEFWEMVYRNFGWIYSNLGQEDDAIASIQRAIDVKKRVGRPASWFDLWDLGRMSAVGALRRNEAASIERSQALVTEALKLHQKVEEHDLVMRAKIWHSVGECSFALGHLAEGGTSSSTGKLDGQLRPEALCHYRKALKCFGQSHKLFRKTEGQHNPLTGGEAQAVAWTLMKLGESDKAKAYLLDALESLSRQQSGWGDGEGLDQQAPALAQAMQTVDRILDAHRQTDDREGLVNYFAAIERLCANICKRIRLSKDRADSAVYEKFASVASMIMVASGTPEGVSKSRELLRNYMWDRPNTTQAQICSQMMASIQDSPNSGGDCNSADAARMGAILDALAGMKC